MSDYTELDIEIMRMSDIETKNALKRLILTLSDEITCAFQDEECPIHALCKKSSYPCDLAWLHFAKGEK